MRPGSAAESRHRPKSPRPTTANTALFENPFAHRTYLGPVLGDSWAKHGEGANGQRRRQGSLNCVHSTNAALTEAANLGAETCVPVRPVMQACFHCFFSSNLLASANIISYVDPGNESKIAPSAYAAGNSCVQCRSPTRRW